jgi:hypothetical protein
MRPVETILGMRGEGIKEVDGRGEFNCDKNFCKCQNVPSLKQKYSKKRKKKLTSAT